MGRSPTSGGQRTPKRRKPRLRFLIACEGDTEVDYFKWLNKRLGGSVILKPVHGWSAPEHVLDLAVRERDADRKAAKESGDPDDVYDGVWIVVDVDEHAHLVQALAEADKAGIRSAVSGPCFEVWLILHKDDRHAAFASSRAAKERWADITGRPRSIQQQLNQLSGCLLVAITRADALMSKHARDVLRHRRNPSTEVGVLVRAIVEAAGVDANLL